MIDPLRSFGKLEWTTLRLEPTGRSGGTCDCCGFTTQRVWGFVQHGSDNVAAYFVSWTVGRKEHDAAFDLIVGPWGETARPIDRGAVSLVYRVTEDGPSFMIVDANGRLADSQTLAGHAFARAETVNTPLASQVFAIVDAVLMTEPRIGEVREWSRS